MQFPHSLDRYWGFFCFDQRVVIMKKYYQKRTKMVHGGTRRSQYGEVSEALFMTQGYIYETAENAETRFLKSRDDEFNYSRYGNPTVAMFEDRMALLEGA